MRSAAASASVFKKDFGSEADFGRFLSACLIGISGRRTPSPGGYDEQGEGAPCRGCPGDGA
jgi:hypothetical protein